ncbi:MAG: UDP-N-acetylmuramate--L-alanine ligase, partial [Candidatus Cloacimonetes bacterium]|nr:UDP-N-acetylmuramate--L-alanine ligase [Candidatus Cloacimonadota bacterium]
EKPIPNVTGKLISDAAIQSGHRNVRYVEKNGDIIAAIKSSILENDIVITMGAGDIHKYGKELLNGK